MGCAWSARDSPRQEVEDHHRRTRPPSGRRTWSSAGSTRPGRTRCGSRTSPTSPTWAGVVYVAFVIDAYARRILGWRAAIEHAHPAGPRRRSNRRVWVRRREGVDLRRAGASHRRRRAIHVDRVTPNASPPSGVSPSIGTVGDAYDNALAETVVGLYKTELINPNEPWKTVDESRSPPCTTSTGSTTPGSTKRTATSHQSSSSRPTTVNTGPQPEAGSHQTESPERPGRSNTCEVFSWALQHAHVDPGEVLGRGEASRGRWGRHGGSGKGAVDRVLLISGLLEADLPGVVGVDTAPAAADRLAVVASYPSCPQRTPVIAAVLLHRFNRS